MAEGLVGGEGFAIDASVIKADANRSRKTTGDEPVDLRDPRHATRAVREYLAALDEQGDSITPPAAISPTDPAAAKQPRYQRPSDIKQTPPAAIQRSQTSAKPRVFQRYRYKADISGGTPNSRNR